MTQSRGGVPLRLAVAFFGLVAASCVARVAQSDLRANAHAANDSDAARTAIIVHSYSGRTEAAGRAIAEMLGARLTTYTDPPPEAPEGQPNGRPLADLDLDAALDGAERIVVGFPIWAGGPPPSTEALIDRLALRGRRLTFLYTYLHFADPVKLGALREHATAAGATVTSDLALRLPLTSTPGDTVRVAQETLLAREDLWAEPEAEPVEECGDEVEHAGALCRIPAGPAWVGDPELGLPPRRVRVAAFELGRTEITQGGYRACVEAGTCARIDLEHSACAFLRADDALPMPCVTIEEARRFCNWVGLRLPTEAEWVRAARGAGTMPFPWGGTDPGASTTAYGNFGERAGRGIPRYELAPPQSTWPDDGVAGLSSGCRYPHGNSPFGVCDLAGNLYEWVEAGAAEPWRPGFAMLKGGSWMDADVASFRVTARAEFYANHSFYLVGFRCARGARQ